jgi:hypothetical protein
LCIAVEADLVRVRAGGGLAAGEGVGAVCAGGGGAEVVPGAGGILTEEGDLSAGEGGAVGGEGAGEGDGLIDGGVGVGGGEGKGGGCRGLGCVWRWGGSRGWV